MAEKKSRKLKWAVHQKRWFGKWHLYLGIIAGALLAVVGLTGSILVFSDEIDQAFNKELFFSMKQQKRYSLEEIAAIVPQKYPGKKVDYVYLPAENQPNLSYVCYNFETEEQFFIDPYTAELAGKRLHHSSFIGFVTELHTNLLMPGPGQYIVGLATLCLLILTISGLRLWIPQQYKKWKQWRSVLTINFKAGFKRQNYDWHNVLGIYSAPVVVMLSLTGFAITFGPLFIAFLFILTGRSPQSVQQIFGQKSEWVKGRPALSPVEAAAVAKKQFPEAVIRGIAYPADSTGAYRFDLRSDGVSKEGNRIMLSIDQYTGKLLLNSETDFPNIGNSYLTWIVPLHLGTFGGWPTRILACLGGLIPLLLFITGFIIWWPRLKKRQGKKSAVPPRPSKDETALQAIRALPAGSYFSYHFKKGLKYGLLILGSAFLSGLLYGVISGIPLQPALFSVLYTGIALIINFLLALLVVITGCLVLLPFKRTIKRPLKYFSLSLSLLLVFVPFLLAIAVLSKDLF
ncbi:PepSY-associated TM helix domain-containing protein [Niabella beijingensis]|uniref:PepSY-associated TM helix domain-containing protein n=1 Tax=Niabella beijingensis TaxID=2872700 RepID=UPI001CBF1EBF|nr:PepSY-associated TM helix domain-containing protein [Niabella beijingensis]MBZ4191885.1 PepSY domain-containing protein [Niabella beijingensis]